MADVDCAADERGCYKQDGKGENDGGSAHLASKVWNGKSQGTNERESVTNDELANLLSAHPALPSSRLECALRMGPMRPETIALAVITVMACLG